jgi:O-antigen/teichoic acid export membrane protein
MSSAKKIAKNTSIYFLANLLSFVITFFTTIYTARYLGANGYGILSLALAFSGIFALISDLGISTLTTRELAKNKSLTDKFVGNTLVIKIMLAIIAIAIIFIIANLGNYSSEAMMTIYIISLSIIVGVFPGIFSSVFQAYEKMEYPSVNIILVATSILMGTLFLIWKGSGVIEFAFLNLGVGLIVLIYSFFVYSWKISIPKIEFDASFLKRIIKESLPFGLISLSGMIYTYLDSIILSLLKPIEVVGWYSAAYRIMLVLLFIPGAINVAVFPVMSKYFSSSQDSLKLIYEKYFKLMIIIVIPIGFGTFLLADKIIFIMFGPSYTNSAVILQILIWTIVFTFLGAPFVQLFQATNCELIITKISVICVILNLILNIILIPKFSYIGASFATLVTEIILVSYIVIVANKMGYGVPKEKALNIIIKVLFSSVVMSVLILYLVNLNLLVLILLSVFIYLLVLFILNGIDDDELNILKQLLKG